MHNDSKEINNKQADNNPTITRELQVLDFWQKTKIFEKSQEGSQPMNFFEKIFGKKNFVFYDGPPFATGLPHYGHILASTVKDAIPRYWTMRGYRIKRRWGWDCHGLPVEVEVEEQLGLENKREVEKYGIDKFNDCARNTIYKYIPEWKKTIKRIGRWVDMENDYRTVDTDYTESVWNIFHRLYKRGFVSEGFKVLHFCPRCGTTLSNNEVSDCYSEVTDIAVLVSFPLRDDSKTAFVAWTTTPWTLFGNVALAINKDLPYAYVQSGENSFIVQENKTHLIPNGTVKKIVAGSKLLNISYIPLYTDIYTEGESGIWKTYHAPFVDAETGTGIVHIAPAYGADDLSVAQKHNLPIKHHINQHGQFIDKVQEFAGLTPKIKGDTTTVDRKIVESLKRKGRLVQEEEIQHPYPFCWRCETPLLQYATTSWFVTVPKYRNAMIAENKRIHWVPEHLRDGRFGNWIKNAKDWSISRSRFWGAPLPVWKSASGKYIVVDSIATMLKHMRSRNKYIFIRHGQSEANEKGSYNCLIDEKVNLLTELGKQQAEKIGENLIEHKPTILISSPMKRTKQTAAIIQKKINLPVRIDDALIEIQAPFFNKKSIQEYHEAINKTIVQHGIGAASPGGESYMDVYCRVARFLEKLEQTHQGETIVIVTHTSCITPARLIGAGIHLSNEFCEDNKNWDKWKIDSNTAISIVPYRFLHRNKDGAIDLHRPYIDNVTLYDEEGVSYKHIGSVFDCWFESGSMPYASHHYPFGYKGNKRTFDPKKRKAFPADFIAEGLDQTRGWFYNLLAIGVGAFDVTPYKNVVVFGLIRARDGKKMSKRLKNYTNPDQILNTYGADALRHYLLASPVVRGEDVDFKDESVADIHRKIYTRLDNCLRFYITYSMLPHRKGDEETGINDKKHMLDRFILSRVAESQEQINAGFISYHLDSATAAIAPLIEDVSLWYLRRSRSRLRLEGADGVAARETLRSVLIRIAKIIAPIAPLYAEYLYQKLDIPNAPESVHLCRWPKRTAIDTKVIKSMREIRTIVSIAHEQRSSANIKVRQPLASLTVPVIMKLNNETIDILRDEVNVKEVIQSGTTIQLDMNITPKLKAEGFARECIRKIQELRKELHYEPLDTIAILTITAPSIAVEQLQEYEELITTITRAKSIAYAPNAEHYFSIDKTAIRVTLQKQ